jgi:hypothetical protein
MDLWEIGLFEHESEQGLLFNPS